QKRTLIASTQSTIANWQLAMVLFLFGDFAFLFLLALADNLGLGRNFAFDRRHLNWLFLHDADGGNNGVSTGEDFDPLARRNVRHVQHIVNAEVRHIHIEVLRNIARFATNLHFANDLFEDTRLFADTNRFTNKT